MFLRELTIFAFFASLLTSASASCFLQNYLRSLPQLPPLSLPTFNPPETPSCNPSPLHAFNLPAALKPTYRIPVDNCGPESSPCCEVKLPDVTTAAIHKPVAALPSPPIPPPKLVSHRIVHYKTYVKPQVYQRLIHVPQVFKFLKKGIAPVVEHIHYKAKPLLPKYETSHTVVGLNEDLTASQNCNSAACCSSHQNNKCPQFVC